VLDGIACSLRELNLSKSRAFRTKQKFGENVLELMEIFICFFLTGDLQGSEEIQPPGLRSGLVRFGQHGHHCRLLHAQGCPRRRGKSPAATLRLHRRRLIGSRLPPQRFRPLLLLTRQNMRSCFIYFLDIFLVSPLFLRILVIFISKMIFSSLHPSFFMIKANLSV